MGKLRTGTLSAESDKAVARELRKQGLTPVYVGLEQKKAFELKLPEFTRGRHATFSSSRRNSPRCSTPACRWTARSPSPAS